jgi:hypothetical protein
MRKNDKKEKTLDAKEMKKNLDAEHNNSTKTKTYIYCNRTLKNIHKDRLRQHQTNILRSTHLSLKN